LRQQEIEVSEMERRKISDQGMREGVRDLRD
jgi:hypothetical protein